MRPHAARHGHLGCRAAIVARTLVGRMAACTAWDTAIGQAEAKRRKGGLRVGRGSGWRHQQDAMRHRT